jgi:hypothetical protein
MTVTKNWRKNWNVVVRIHVFSFSFIWETTTTREQSVIQFFSLQSLGQKKISHKLLRRYDVQHRVVKFGVKISLFLLVK